MKKLALAAVIGSPVLTGPAGPANAQTSPNQTFTVVKVGADPGSVVRTGVIRGASGGGGAIATVAGQDADGNCLGPRLAARLPDPRRSPHGHLERRVMS